MSRWRSKLLPRYGARWALGLLMTLAASLHVWAFFDSDSVERLDGFLSGLRMRVEQPVLDPRIVIVDIDEKSLAQVGRFPWSRDIQADLVTKLTKQYKVGAIGFDISFPEADNSSGYKVLEKLAREELKDVPGLKSQLALLESRMDYDGLFASAMAGQPVVLGYSVSERHTKGMLPAPAFTVEQLNGRDVAAYEPDGFEANIARLQQAARGAGIFTALTDADGVIRSSTLLQRIGDGYYPSLALATAAVYLDASAITPVFAPGGLDEIVMFTPQRAVSIPVGYGLVTTVQFRGKGGPGGGAFRYVPAVDVLTGAADAAVLKGAIVLVGTTAPGLKDIRVTPVNAEYPGVEVHANLIKSILDGRFKSRPDFALAVEFLQVLGFGLALTFALAVLSPLRSIVLAGAAFCAAALFNYWMYAAQDIELNSATLALLIAALFVFNVVWGYFFEVRKGRALVSRFGEYVAPELVAEMAEDPGKYNMDGDSRELSVMFADVRGFTTISEGLPPKELREYINLYLTAMSENIRDSHRGTLDKYIGDAVMAFWGAPVHFPDHASRAVATALLMQASVTRLNDQFRTRGWPRLQIGIGVNSGLMHVGDMGSTIRRAYTVMGDAVNVAARLEGITKVYGAGIAVGEATRAAAPEFLYRELDRVRVKGKSEPIAMFEPVGRRDAVDAAIAHDVAQWSDALAMFRARDWDGAAAALERLAAVQPRGLYHLYLERIARFRLDPPGTDWDGVTNFDTK